MSRTGPVDFATRLPFRATCDFAVACYRALLFLVCHDFAFCGRAPSKTPRTHPRPFLAPLLQHPTSRKHQFSTVYTATACHWPQDSGYLSRQPCRCLLYRFTVAVHQQHGTRPLPFHAPLPPHTTETPPSALQARAAAVPPRHAHHAASSALFSARLVVTFSFHSTRRCARLLPASTARLSA